MRRNPLIRALRRAALALDDALSHNHQHLTIEARRARGLETGSALFLALAIATAIGLFLAVRA